MILNIPLSGQNLSQIIQKQTYFDDQKILPHLSNIIELVNNDNINDLNLVQLSNVVKQTQTKIGTKNPQNKLNIKYEYKQQKKSEKYSFQIQNFIKQSQKLEIAGISLGQKVNQKIQSSLLTLIIEKSLLQARFWGKIIGTQKDYYIIQAYKQPPKQHLNIPLGSQKPGQGVNYYSYFVTNDIFNQSWQQLPQITLQQMRVSRQIKKLFTGNLNSHINSYPVFLGLQKHYLKSQIVRITHSLQISPKGIYKVNDDNPKLTQYEEEVKIPDFSQLSTLEGWVHRNSMILAMGRCTHFVDPSLSEADLQAQTARLAQQDPEIQRLRAIPEDKPVQIQQGGPQCFWVQRTYGNNQVFPKDEAQNVYAVTALKNIQWPGWITIGFANGFSNFYLGTGLKATQPCWNNFSNNNLQEQGQQTTQFREPNPKDLPKIQQPPIDQNAPNQQGDVADQ